MKRAPAHLPIVLALLLSAPPTVGQEIRYGPEAPLGEGTARTYLILDGEQPLELGFALSESSFHGLPELADAPDEQAFFLVDLELPEGNPTPFRFAALDWNPRGHVPPMYLVPHFDFHFYLIDPETRDAILPADPADYASFESRGILPVGAGMLPDHYIYAPESTIPRMGAHWIDPASHELHGSTFDTTYLYGTWDGSVIFWEPMMTKAYVESRPDATIEIATPARVATPGWYPSAYRVGYDAEAREYRIALVDFAER